MQDTIGQSHDGNEVHEVVHDAFIMIEMGVVHDRCRQQASGVQDHGLRQVSLRAVQAGKGSQEEPARHRDQGDPHVSEHR